MLVSQGTLRPQDLIPKFLETLRSIDEDEYDRFLRSFPEASDIQEELTPEQEELSGEMIDSLIVYLTDNAPKGQHFGAHEGDGTLFGFWEFSDREEW